MFEVLCTCDWGLENLPPHYHQMRSWVRRERDGEIIVRGLWIEQPGYTLLREEEEIHIPVAWRTIARAFMVKDN